jgi:hypothetical protein
MPDITTPFGFPYPEATDLVRDGAQDIENLATDVNDYLANGYIYAGTIYYTSSGDFEKADPFGTGDIGVRAVRVRMVGGGGGSGGNTATGANQVSAATGGGGGGYAEKFITDIAGLSSSETVTRGAGGAAGAAGNNNGSAGGNSTAFGVTANGGGFGRGSGALAPADAFPIRATGGAASGGDFGVTGEPSLCFVSINANRVIPSASGGSFFAAGLSQNVADVGAAEQLAAAGNAPGGGALGPTKAQNSSTNRAGAAGADGIVIVDVFV